MKKEELALARQIISGLESDFDPGDLQSEYRARLRDLLEAKRDGTELAAPAAEAEDAPVVDLMEALRASVAASKSTGEAPKKPAARRTRAAAKN